MLRSAFTALRRLPLRRLLRVGLWLTLGAAFGMWLHAPINAALTRLTREAAANSGYRIEFAEAWMGPFGPTLSGVRAQGPVNFVFDRATIRPRWQTLLFRPGLAASARRGDGVADISLGLSGLDVAAAFRDFDVFAAGPGQNLKFGIAVHGRLTGDLELRGDPAAPESLTGTVALNLRDASLQLPATLPLPVSHVALGDVVIGGSVAAGTAKIGPVTIDGPDMRGSLRGNVALRLPLSRSTVELRIRLEPGEALAGTVGTYLPIAGFRRERDAWVRDFSGPLANLGM